MNDKLAKHVSANRDGLNQDAEKILNGVTAGFLSTVFATNPHNTKRKLAMCPVKGRRTAGNVYDLKEAARYLVTPVFDPEEYIKTMKPGELPPALQDAFWSALRKKQNWEEEAGDLWRTEDVISALGEVFQLMKTSMQLWPDTVQRSVGLTDVQFKNLQAQVDGLQASIHKELLAKFENDDRRAQIREKLEHESSGGLGVTHTPKRRKERTSGRI